MQFVGRGGAHTVRRCRARYLEHVTSCVAPVDDVVHLPTDDHAPPSGDAPICQVDVMRRPRPAQVSSQP